MPPGSLTKLACLSDFRRVVADDSELLHHPEKAALANLLCGRLWRGGFCRSRANARPDGHICLARLRWQQLGAEWASGLTGKLRECDAIHSNDHRRLLLRGEL